MPVAHPHRIAVLAFDGISPFHLSVPNLVFGNGALGSDDRPYSVRTCALLPGRLATSAGYDIVVDRGLELLSTADTVIIPSWEPRVPTPLPVLEALRNAHAAGVRIVGLCLGAIPIAESGILDGREVTTHWRWGSELAIRRPAVRVRTDLLWSDHGDVITSAGVSAALDCCVHVLRHDLGSARAAEVSRSIVLAPHRSGNQAQFALLPEPPVAADPIGQAQAHALDNLAEPLDLERWSRSANMSRRTFSRRFAERTGTTPAKWLAAQRLDAARRTLELSNEPVESIARRCGFGSALVLRQLFAKAYKTTPGAYREAFGSRA